MQKNFRNTSCDLDELQNLFVSNGGSLVGLTRFHTPFDKVLRNPRCLQGPTTLSSSSKVAPSPTTCHGLLLQVATSSGMLTLPMITPSPMQQCVVFFALLKDILCVFSHPPFL